MADDEVGIERTGSDEVRDAKVESVQEVTDRVRSYQAGAPIETVRAELVAALAKAGTSLADDEIDQIAQRISDEQGVDVQRS